MLSLTLFFIAIIFYVYFGYLALVLILSRFINKKVKKQDIEPEIGLMIAAYNEEKVILAKIENSLALDYPKNKLNIYVVSDASSDRTDEIVNGIEDSRVHLIRVEGRVGKTQARNIALKKVSEPIVVFSDATTVYDKMALRKMVRNFADPEVGMVTGLLTYTIPKGSTMGLGQRIFWQYESFIKSAQTRLGTLTGSLGCMTAYRREFYTDLPANIIEDFTSPLMFIQKGFRVVYEPQARCYEEATMKAKQEWGMRVRVIRGGMTGLLFAKKILNPLQYPSAAFQLISHKVLRWLVPVFALAALVCNILAVASGPNLFAQILLMLQLSFYGMVYVAHITEKTKIKIPLVNIFHYLFIVNLASLVALYKVTTSQLEATWEPDRRGQKV